MISVEFDRSLKKKILDGSKICTARRRRLGYAGDTFEVFGATFRIVAVQIADLGFVAERLHQCEGFSTPGEFVSAWNRFYGPNEFDPMHIVFIHYFTKEEG